jgi:hypothetical protein
MCGTVTPIKKLTFHAGICVGPAAVQVEGNCKRYQCWGDRIYIKRLVWDSYGQELWSNKGERKANGRPRDSQINYVHR